MIFILWIKQIVLLFGFLMHNKEETNDINLFSKKKYIFVKFNS